MRVIGVRDCRRRRPQAGRDRQRGRDGAGRSHLYRASEPSTSRCRGRAGSIPRRAGARLSWVWRHESGGTYVKFTPAGAEVFA